MKKGLIILVTLILCWQGACFAITDEELEEAEGILCDMNMAINNLFQYVSAARQRKLLGIPLNAEQKQDCKDRYMNEKSELVDLYQQLP